MSDPIQVKISIAQAVREAIDSDLSIQDSVQRSYGNLTAIARLLKKTVEEKTGKKTNIDSLVTAVKRSRGLYKGIPKEIISVVSGSIVNVRTHVAKISVEKNKKALESIGRTIIGYREEFIQVSESVSAITLVFDQRLLNEVKSMFKEEELLENKSDLAAITVQSPLEIIQTPGCAITFYNQVSRRRINIEDTTSCYTDTILIVKMTDAGRAFQALTDLISASQRVKN